MPKKFQTENTKSVQARERKAETKAAAKAQQKKENDDEIWRDDDKHIAKKQQRKADKEKRRQEELLRKQENRKLLEEEEVNFTPKTPSKPEKITRAQIAANQEAAEREAAAAAKPDPTHLESKLEDNPNIAAANAVAQGIEEARNVEDAISVLSIEGKGKVDKHPEKRMKAAYLAFEEENLPRLKAENPNLRLSQLKQMLKKDWMKSPENPLNQR